MLLYIHGFLSSPQSHKALQVKQWCEIHHPGVEYQCPSLTAYPEESIKTLEAIVESASGDVALIGSSLGGFYSTFLAEKYNLKAVLINPAVEPHRLMTHYIHVDLANYHTDQHYRLSELHIDQLKALDVNPLVKKENYWLMVQTEDETLDYRAAVKKYKGCRQLVEEGGDHSFQKFERWLPDVFEFLSITK